MSFYPARRHFLKQSTIGLSASLLSGLLRADTSLFKNRATTTFHADVELEFSTQNAYVPIMPGNKTAVQKFYARLIAGPQDTLQPLANNYLGPILKLQQGQKVRVFFTNRLTEPTIIHWHGLHVPQASDGHPMYTIGTNESYIYEFEVKNPAGTSFYHSHAHHLTAEQVYRGLAGLIIVSDEQERRLELPNGEFDIPLVIQDRRFSTNNQLQYIHSMPERMLGFLGETILVNGKPNAEFSVKSRVYRFRAVNGSNSRIYKLAWEDGTPLTAIGTDAGLLAKPTVKPYIMLAPGERVDLWLDFSGRKQGTKLSLISLAFSGAMPTMHEQMANRHGNGGMAMMMPGLMQGSRLTIATFNITEQVTDSPTLPRTLVSLPRLSLDKVDNPNQALPIALAMQPMQALLNGKSFAIDKVMDFENVALGSYKYIKIFHDHQTLNRHGGMGMMGMAGMMDMAHPIHLHGQQFQILKRNSDNVNQADYQTVKDGFIDTGWKDTVLVMPGEAIEIIKPFQDYKGLFLYHCHNLEHEDLGMMRQFLVS